MQNNERMSGEEFKIFVGELKFLVQNKIITDDEMKKIIRKLLDLDVIQ